MKQSELQALFYELKWENCMTQNPKLREILYGVSAAPENEVRREWWTTKIAKLQSKTFLGVVLFFCGFCICLACLLRWDGGGDVNIGGQEHFYLEPHTARVEPKEGGELIVYNSTQNPSETQLFVHKAAGIAMPVVKTKLIAFDVTIYNNAGWCLDLSQPILNRAMLHIQNACFVPYLKVTGSMCKTNIESNTAFRGFGGPQGMFVAESAYDDLARTAGCTREDIISANLMKSGDKMHYGQALSDVPLEKMWKSALQSSEMDKRRKEIEEFNFRNRYKKRGLAAGATHCGISFTATHMNQPSALVHLNKDGTVMVSHGGVEMGQGFFRNKKIEKSGFQKKKSTTTKRLAERFFVVFYFLNPLFFNFVVSKKKASTPKSPLSSATCLIFQSPQFIF